jgi:serine/threonine-protein kinase RIO1
MTNDSVTKTWVGGIVNKTSGKNNFDSIMNMLKNPRCQITTISYSSKYGFILHLRLSKQEGEANVPDADIEFYGLNESKTAFDSPIDAVVIKLAVLHDRDIRTGKEKELSPYHSFSGLQKSVHKLADTIENYKKEALMQSKIYQLTASKGEPVCPSLIDFSHISDRLAIETFLDIVLKKCVDDESKHIIQYLKNAFVYSKQTERMYMDDVQLGIITMESASDYITAYNALWDWDLYGESYFAFCEQILTQVLRLYNETHLVHVDFHMFNCLVKKNEDGSCRVYMIDFGRMVDADNLNQIQMFLAHKYAVSKFHRHHFFDIDKNTEPPELFVVPTIRKKEDHFDRKLCENLLFFIISLDYMNFNEKLNITDMSYLHNIYYKALDPATSLDKIATALNNYYNTQGVSIQRFDNYNILKPGENYDRTIQDIQGDDMPQETGTNTAALPVSPSRFLQQRKEAIPVSEERYKKRSKKPFNKNMKPPPFMQKYNDNESTNVSMSTDTHFDRMGTPHSYSTVATSFSDVKGGRTRKLSKRKKTMRKKSKRGSRKTVRKM